MLRNLLGPALRAVRRAIPLATGLTIVLALPASASSATSVALDPIGDSAAIAGPGSTPSYLDIASVAVTKESGGFAFATTVASLIPDQPEMPPQVKEIWWFWGLDTNAATFPTGYPRGPGLAFPPEFLIAVAWNGTEFTAFVVDRRPTLDGMPHVIVPLAFQVQDSTVTAYVPASTVGNPDEFGFSAATRAWRGHPGTEGFIFTDYVGSPGTFHPWPS